MHALRPPLVLTAIVAAVVLSGACWAAAPDDLLDQVDRWGRYDANLFYLTVAEPSRTVNAMGETFQRKKNDIVRELANDIAAAIDDVDEVENAIASHLAAQDTNVWTDEFAQDLVAALDGRGVDTSLLRVRASRSYRSAEFEADLEGARQAIAASGSLLQHLYVEDGDIEDVVDALTTKASTTTRASNFQSQTLKFFGPGEFALTFDDGPHTGGRTTRVLDALKNNGLKATFFQLGSTLAPMGKTSLTARITAEGHDVGVHGWYHATQAGKPFPTMGSAEVRSDLTRASQTITNTYGRKPVTFRAPYGEFRNSDFDILRDLGLTYVGWDIDTNDWQKKTPEALAAEAISLIDARGKGIVLMHDVQERTSLACDAIMAHIKRKGYRCVTIREKLAGGGAPDPVVVTPPSPPVGGGQTGIVTVSSTLNVRSQPSTGSSVVGTLRGGDRVTILASSDGWYKIQFQGGTGWVSGDYVKVA